jgi:hypothetical protein
MDTSEGFILASFRQTESTRSLQSAASSQGARPIGPRQHAQMRFLGKDHILDSRYSRDLPSATPPYSVNVPAIINNKFYNLPSSSFVSQSLQPSNPPSLRPLTLPIIPTNPASQRPPQNPLLRRDILLVPFPNPQLLTRLPYHPALPQRLEQNLIPRPRKIYQTHPLAPRLLARRADDSVDIASQDRSGESHEGVTEVDD